MRGEVVERAEQAAAIEGVWSPRIVEQMNDMHVKVVRAHGAFVWHEHPDTDELFIVLGGRLRIELEGRASLPPAICSSCPAASATGRWRSRSVACSCSSRRAP